VPDKENEATGEGGPAGEQKSSKLWTPFGEPDSQGQEPEAFGPDEEDSEEMRERIEEALEKLSIAQYLLDMAVELASLAYLKMGIPPDVNAKFKDMEQARLAIDAVDAIVQVLGDRIPEEAVSALTGTVDNLKMNFAKES
jgi:Domain of unknown function (DUF1844)